LIKSSERGDDVSIIETAGGVLSPAPSGSSQADLYRDLRLPAVLVGDYHLGGIGSTISAYESLKIRGYDVLLHLMFEEDEFKNVQYLTTYFDKRGVPTLALPKPPKPLEDPEEDMESMWSYYSNVASLDMVYRILDQLKDNHSTRISELHAMKEKAHNIIWYPFTQHQGRTPEDIMVIDSAYKSHFDALAPSTSTKSDSLLRPAVDGSASWWTQGLGHGNSALSLAAAYAAGRYGHVMFAGAIHEPALKVAETLLQHHKNPRLAKVFYSDNGSTGIEVALKMALRASCARYGWDHKANDIEVVGLKGSYHGDTMGTMDSSEPSVYNDRVEWYRSRGCKLDTRSPLLKTNLQVWFDFPQVMFNGSNWEISVPSELATAMDIDSKAAVFSSPDLDSIFDSSRGTSDLYSKYQSYLESTLADLRASGRKFGALILEPILLGAGGMLFCDPLFQRALIDLVRSKPELISEGASSAAEPNWSGLPVIFDEVFVGLYRLGHFNSNELVHATPDIVVNAKLLTGGLVPLATTTASQSIFDAFLGDSKTDALLHGHSYTAHAVGCQVAVESLHTMLSMESDGFWKKSFGLGSEKAWTVWEREQVGEIAKKEGVEGVVAMGTVLAIRLKDASGGGYTSEAAQTLQKALAPKGNEPWAIHSRVLGNVIYFMSSLTVTQRTTRAVLQKVLQEL